MCTCKEEYLKIVQPWQEEVSQIALQVDAKISEFKAMQTIVTSLLEALVSAELIDIVRECIDQIDRDLVEVKVGFVQFTTKVKGILKKPKTSNMLYLIRSQLVHAKLTKELHELIVIEED